MQGNTSIRALHQDSLARSRRWAVGGLEGSVRWPVGLIAEHGSVVRGLTVRHGALRWGGLWRGGLWWVGCDLQQSGSGLVTPAAVGWLNLWSV